MIHPRSQINKYVNKKILLTGKGNDMTELEEFLQAIDELIGSFDLPICENCEQDELEHRLKSEGGGIVCMLCGKTYYMTLNGDDSWVLETH